MADKIDNDTGIETHDEDCTCSLTSRTADQLLDLALPLCRDDVAMAMEAVTLAFGRALAMADLSEEEMRAAMDRVIAEYEQTQVEMAKLESELTGDEEDMN